MQAIPLRNELTDQAAAPGGPARAPRRQRWILWLIIVICALPSVLAAGLYFAPAWAGHVPGARAVIDWLTPDGRTNYGRLVQPQRPLTGFAAQDLDGRTIDLRALRGRWIMVSVVGAQCDALCTSHLYLMRQVRTSMGKDRGRIERLLILTGPARIDAATIEAYSGTKIVHAQESAVDAWIGEAVPAAQGGAIYLVDPLGNLMMRWPGDASPAKVRKDLSRLLWASSIG